MSKSLLKYVWVINLVLLGILSYTLAHIVSEGIGGWIAPPFETETSKADSSGSSPVGFQKLLSRDAYEIIVKRDVFNPEASNSKLAEGVLSEEAPKTTLKIHLIGTLLNDSNSMAIIKNTEDEEVEGYRVGEEINIVKSESVKLVKIENCKAVIERPSGYETIDCEEEVISTLAVVPPGIVNPIAGVNYPAGVSPPGAAGGGEISEGIREVTSGTYEVDRGVLNEALSDLNQLVTQARIIPTGDGVKIFSIGRQSLFRNIGLRNGDVIHRINETEMSNIENALSIFEDLRNQQNFKIDITRHGQKMTFDYTVK